MYMSCIALANLVFSFSSFIFNGQPYYILVVIKSKIYCASSHYERKNSSEIPIEEVAQKTGAENE